MVFHDGTDFWLADGFHRVLAATRMKLEFIPVKVIKGTQDDAAWYALGANRTNGLRLSAAEKHAAVEKALDMRPDVSDRTIGNYVGVSDKTVAKCRSELDRPPASTAEIPQLKRTGLDGKKRALPKPKSSNYNDFQPETDDDPPPSTEPEKVPLCTSSRTVISDGLGRKVTHAGLAEAIRRDQELIDLATAISRVKTAVLAAKERDDPLFHDIMASQFEVDCGNLHRTIQSARPYTVCPYCGGDECKACKGRGWVNKMTYEMAPPEMKA